MTGTGDPPPMEDVSSSDRSASPIAVETSPQLSQVSIGILNMSGGQNVSGLSDNSSRISSLQQQFNTIANEFHSTIYQLNAQQRTSDENFRALYHLLQTTLSLSKDPQMQPTSVLTTLSGLTMPVISSITGMNPENNQSGLPADLRPDDPDGSQTATLIPKNDLPWASDIAGGHLMATGHCS
jgi:hypothetical protein